MVECLNSSGWYPNRALDATTFVEALNATGFVVHEAAADFLKEYGGLYIKYPHAKIANMEDEMHFDPFIVIRHITPDTVNAYAKVLDKKLCPIWRSSSRIFNAHGGRHRQSLGVL